MLIVIIIILIMAVAFCIIACGKNFLPKYDQAISIAQEYLDQKYNQKMIYKDIRKAPIDPGVYHVTFSPAKNPEIEFEVIIPNSLTLPERVFNFDQGDWSADNYYFKYFEYHMKEYLAGDVNRLWGDNVTLRVTVIDDGIFFTIPPELNDTMTLEEMKTLIDNYRISITGDDVPADSVSLDVLANKIFEFIQIIKSEGFIPERINYSAGSETDRVNVGFTDLNQIETVTQVIEQLEVEFAGEVE